MKKILFSSVAVAALALGTAIAVAQGGGAGPGATGGAGNPGSVSGGAGGGGAMSPGGGAGSGTAERRQSQGSEFRPTLRTCSTKSGPRQAAWRPSGRSPARRPCGRPATCRPEADDRSEPAGRWPGDRRDWGARCHRRATDSASAELRQRQRAPRAERELLDLDRDDGPAQRHVLRFAAGNHTYRAGLSPLQIRGGR